ANLFPFDAEPCGSGHAVARASELDAINRVTAGRRPPEPHQIDRAVHVIGARPPAIVKMTLGTGDGVRPWSALRPLPQEALPACPELVPAKRVEVRQRAAERGRSLVEDRGIAAQTLLSRLGDGHCRQD